MSGLLELGGGFHLDLTGRENVVTAGVLVGLTASARSRACVREIVAFAELEDVIDHPVRTYSSGMYLRLAFAVAVHFDPEILVIDEVLAVGDARFQQKCLDPHRQHSARPAARWSWPRTSPSRSGASATTVLVLDEGRAVLRDGAGRARCSCYDELMLQRTERRARALGGRGEAPAPTGEGVRHGTQEASIEAVRLHDPDGQPAAVIGTGDGLAVELDYRLPAAGVDVALGLGIYSEAHEKCFEMLVESAAAMFGPLAARGTLRCELPALPLRPARYVVAVGLYPPGCDLHLRLSLADAHDPRRG